MTQEITALQTVESGFDAALHQLELRRITLYREIDKLALCDSDRVRAFAEVDFLVDYAKARRVQIALHEWVKARDAYKSERLASRIELASRLVMERDRIRMHLFESRLRRSHAALDVMERIQRLAPKDDSRAFITRARKALLHQQFASRLAQKNRRHLQEELADMVLARGRFLKRVRREFPDMEDELMEKFDTQLFQRGLR